MKFPKSMHPEGFYDRLDKTAPEHPPEALKPTAPGVKPTVKAGARPLTGGSHPLLREESMPAAEVRRSASTAPAAPRIERSRTAPWVLGVGVGVLLVAVAVMMSRNLPAREPATPPATVVGQASTSPEDAQLQAAPPSAGPATLAPEQATPTGPATPAAPIVEPRREPTLAAAAPIAAKPSSIVRAAPNTPAPAPVTRTPSPAPEVVAQASPPPAALQPAPAVTPAPVPAATPASPLTTPPLAQTGPQPQPPVAAPEDAGITVQVRMALAADTALAAVPIAVSTDHGVVKLEGQAPDAQTRERATVVASAATGVKAVDNRLTLPPATLVSQAPSAQ